MPGHHTRKSFQVHGPFASGKPGEHVYPTEKRANTAARKLDAHIPKPGADGHEYHVKMYGTGTHTVKPVTASKALKWGPDGGNTIAEPHHGSYDVVPKRGGSAKLVYHPKTGTTPRPRQDLGVHRTVAAAQAVAEQHHASVGKSTASVQLMTLDEYYDLVKDMDPAKVQAYHADAARRTAPDPKRTLHVDRAPPTVGDVASRAQNERRGVQRKPKPTVQMKPISNEEAMQHLRSGTYDSSKQKSLRWLITLKALATGYGRTSGGGALKAANRGAALPLLGPSGRLAGKPGGHYRKRGLGGKTNFGPDGRPGPRTDEAQFGKRSSRRLRRAVEAMSSPVGSSASSSSEPRAPLAAHARSPRALDAGGAAELSNSLSNVVLKSEGAEMPRQSHTVDFDDLFKSELESDHLVDCPHCEEPITRADLAKAHKGKGAVTHQSGPKHGKSSAHVRDHNPEGGTTRGGDGRGVHTPSRGVPGAKRTDPPAGVQNSKGSRARKGGNDDSSSDSGSDDVDKSAGAEAGGDPAGAPAEPVKKSIIVRGTPFVQYVDDGSDEAIAKAIAEGTLGGTSPTRPLDLNNDLTRLLI